MKEVLPPRDALCDARCLALVDRRLRDSISRFIWPLIFLSVFATAVAYLLETFL